MNRTLVILLPLFAFACEGKLTQEQRDKLQEGMATQDIRRVTDAELQEAATRYGQDLLTEIERIDRYLLKKGEIDSLAGARGVIIFSLTQETAVQKIEKDLVDAYIAAAANGVATDNLQAVGTDSLLFTRPVLKLHPDGSQEFSHAIAIRMALRSVILSMPQP